MAIKYYLQPNPITPDPTDQMARIQASSVLETSDIVKRVIRRGTTVNEADALAVLSLAFDEMAEAIAEGNNVNTPFIRVRPSIQGVFASASDSFDRSRHVVNASISPGRQLQQRLTEASVEKVIGFVVSPDIVEFRDVRTDSTLIASPGGIGTLIGSELKYNVANAAEGIYFIRIDSGEATKVTEVAQRTEGKLMFIVPGTLTPGSYTIEVRRAYTNAGTIRSDAYDEPVTVS